jgi:hypothetical protein
MRINVSSLSSKLQLAIKKEIALVRSQSNDCLSATNSWTTQYIGVPVFKLDGAWFTKAFINYVPDPVDNYSSKILVAQFTRLMNTLLDYLNEYGMYIAAYKTSYTPRAQTVSLVFDVSDSAYTQEDFSRLQAVVEAIEINMNVAISKLSMLKASTFTFNPKDSIIT